MNALKLVMLLVPALLAAQSRSVVLTWQAGTGNPAGTTYNVYRATAPCAPLPSMFAKLNVNAVTGVTFTDTTAAIGSTYCYGVKSSLNSLESAFSNLAETGIAPGPPTGLTIAPQVATVKPGASQQFVATIPVSRWTLSPAMGVISSDGLYRAPASIQGNNKKVTVQAEAGLESDTATITIKK